MSENTPPYPPFQRGKDAGDASVPQKRQKAVAVEYKPEQSGAPRVVASGQGHLAEQILQLAFAHGVKVREDADLVEILSVLDIDSPIPVEAYAAVGEILSYVYRANARVSQGKPVAEPRQVQAATPAGNPAESHTQPPTEGGNHDR